MNVPIISSLRLLGAAVVVVVVVASLGAAVVVVVVASLGAAVVVVAVAPLGAAVVAAPEHDFAPAPEHEHEQSVGHLQALPLPCTTIDLMHEPSASAQQALAMLPHSCLIVRASQ